MNTSSTRLATCVPVVTSPLSVVRAAQFSWPTHKRLRGDAEGPLLADCSRSRRRRERARSGQIAERFQGRTAVAQRLS